ncbi:alpha/beta hydrolase [Nocardioides sp. CCNWLW239]|uniref:alpha/beta hydrolase n=1 Tax=Nocardioides sp. CCNWLW239 TaxID=3128902 RepID=UPI00301AC854
MKRTSLTLIAAAAAISAGIGVVSAPSATARTTPTAQQAAHAGQSSLGADYTPPPIEWGECPTASLQRAGAVCGMLTVPLDYSRPKGTKIQLAVSKVAHKTSDADAQGAMLVNPGGPGGSGLGLARLGQFVPKQGGDPYDWIGFDPRGVGRSTPQLSCDGDYAAPGRPAYVPEGPATERFWLSKAAAYAADCGRAQPEFLRNNRTTDTVADMESLRKALGERKINFYGFSYGTYLGQVYATLHPERVRRFVFDGVVDPRNVWYEANLNQERQFDANIDTFFNWVAENDDAYGLGTDGRKVRAIYYDILEQLTDDPEENFGAADWNDVFVSAAYYVYDWDSFAHILAAAAGGDLGPAKEWYGNPTGPGADNGFASYLSVQCTDVQWPSWRKQRHDAYKLAATKPFLTWNNTWYNAPCLTWPAPAGTPVKVDGRKAPGILMIEETYDAATPWAGAIEVRKRFPRSALIEGVGGTTHSGSLSGVACTDDRIADYLLTGELPQRKPGNNRSDVKCDPVPTPEPTPVEGAGAAADSQKAAGAASRLGSLRTQLVDAQLVSR